MANPRDHLIELLGKAFPSELADTVNFRALRDLLEASVMYNLNRMEHPSPDVAIDVAVQAEKVEVIEEIVENNEEVGLKTPVKSEKSPTKSASSKGGSPKDKSTPSHGKSKKEKHGASRATSPKGATSKSASHDEDLKVVVKLPKGIVCNDKDNKEFTFSIAEGHLAKEPK